MDSVDGHGATHTQCKDDSGIPEINTPKGDIPEINTPSLSTSTTTTTTQFQTTPTFGKVLLLLSGIINFGISYGFPTSLSVYFLDWQDSFQESRAYTATIHATCVGTLNIWAILPGLVMSRYGDRVTLLVGCLLACLGMILSMFATGVTYMIFSTGILFGMGCCMINLPTIPCITSVFTRNQSIYIASLTFGSGVMNTILPFFYRFLSREYGWRGSFLILGGLVLHTFVTSLIITSYSTSHTKRDYNSSISERLLEDKGIEHEKPLEEKKSMLSAANFLLEGISLTSLHSSKFGSQLLGARLNKTNDIHFFGSKESVLRSRESVLLSEQPDFYSQELEVVTSEHDSSCLTNLKTNHPYLFDSIFIVAVLASSFCLAAVYSTIALMMDFAKFKGYDDEATSVFFVFIAFLCSMIGKIFTGVTNLIPAVHSIYLICSYGFVTCILMVILIYVYNYYALCVLFSLMGFVLGGMASVYPKCVLDMGTVDVKTFPIALGINNSLVGIFDASLPVIMGYTVDRCLSYTPILYIYSSVSLVLSTVLFASFCLKRTRGTCRSRKK